MIGARIATLAAALGLAACTEGARPGQPADAARPDAVTPDAGGLPDADAAPAPLAADPGPSRYAFVGEEVVLDGSGSTGAVAYQWYFGDGRGWDAPRPEPRAVVVYDAPGRYRATLTVFDGAGARRTASTVITATPRPRFEPRHSATIAWVPALGGVAVAVPDADVVALIGPDGDGGWRVERRLPTPARPRTLARVDASSLAVACEDADAVLIAPLDPELPPVTVPLPRGSRPYGVVATEAGVFVTLPGTGEVAHIPPPFDGATPRRLPVGPDPRGIAALPDGRLAVTRWRSPPEGGVVFVLDPVDGAVREIRLAFDPQPASDTEIGGVPSYLDPVLVSPAGDEIALPSLQANIGQGLFIEGEPLRHDTTVRAVVSFVDGARLEERFEARKQFDERGFAAAGVYSRFGDYLFVAMRGSRAVERLDRYEASHSGTLSDVGYAPAGLALSPDDRLLFVDASLSREVVVYDVTGFADLPRPLARVRTVDHEPLAPAILRGKQLFNDSLDPRLSRAGYVACAHCHLDGDADNFVWDFTDRGEGLRNTISLIGRGGAAHGPIHWSGNFDEIQDFEHDIRGAFGGRGLMEDADFHAAMRDRPLGGPKAGASEDLDALAAYVSSLGAWPPSPYRRADGGLTAAAERGRALFESPALGCTGCHAGPRLTDSAFEAPGAPRLHDVGTLGPGSGGRLGGPLAGIDTPTLHGLWRNAPYLHDGSAPTLRDVLTTRNPADRHGTTTHLDEEELADLEAYLLSLDGAP